MIAKMCFKSLREVKLRLIEIMTVVERTKVLTFPYLKLLFSEILLALSLTFFKLYISTGTPSAGKGQTNMFLYVLSRVIGWENNDFNQRAPILDDVGDIVY